MTHRVSSTWPNNLLPGSANNTKIRFAHSPESLAQRFGAHPFRAYQFGLLKAKQGVEGVVVYRPFSRWGVKGVSLLTAYGADLPTLLARWMQTLANENVAWGMTNVAAVKRMIEHILDRPNFAGEVIMFENTHFRMSDGSGLSRAWVAASERNVDVPGWRGLGDLITHFK